MYMALHIPYISRWIGALCPHPSSREREAEAAGAGQGGDGWNVSAQEPSLDCGSLLVSSRCWAFLPAHMHLYSAVLDETRPLVRRLNKKQMHMVVYLWAGR